MKKEKTGLKVKVENFTKGGKFFCIRYNYSRSFRNNILTEAYIRHDTEFLCDLNHPMLFYSFKKACDFAKNLSIEKIEEHLNNEKEKYDNHIKKIREEEKKRNKSQEFDL